MALWLAVFAGLYKLLMVDADLAQHYRLYLEAGCKMYTLKAGFFATVKGDLVKVQATKGDARIHPGSQLSLEKQPWHKDLISGKHFAVHQLQNPIIFNEPAYNGAVASTVIGAPILINSQLYGVIVFYADAFREEPFSNEDQETINLMAEGVAKMVQLHRVFRDKAPREESFATEGVKSLEEYRLDAQIPVMYGVSGRVIEVLLKRIGHQTTFY